AKDSLPIASIAACAHAATNSAIFPVPDQIVQAPGYDTDPGGDTPRVASVGIPKSYGRFLASGGSDAACSRRDRHLGPSPLPADARSKSGTVGGSGLERAAYRHRDARERTR